MELQPLSRFRVLNLEVALAVEEVQGKARLKCGVRIQRKPMQCSPILAPLYVNPLRGSHNSKEGFKLVLVLEELLCLRLARSISKLLPLR